MSKQKTLTFKNVPVAWARVFEDNRDMSGATMPDGTPYNPAIRDVMEGQYTISVFLDVLQLEELRDSGSQAADYAKPNDEFGSDLHEVRLKRPHKKFNRKGELLDWASGAPKTNWDFETDGPIGNGSTCDITIIVYTVGTMVGTRLEEVKVVDHVPVETDEAA